VVLKPPARSVKRIAYGNMEILVRAILGRLPIHHDHAAGNRQTDPHMIYSALPMVSVGRLYRDLARAYPVGKLLQLVRPVPDLRFGRG
jgi:hypothetical protein